MRNNIEYQNAFSELTEILKTISKEELDKIPKSIIDYIHENRNINYNFHYSKYKTLREQQVSTLTKQLLIVLFRDYFANEKQKRWIAEQERMGEIRSEEKKREKYGDKPIFEKEFGNSENMKLEVTYKSPDSFIDKILDMIFGKRIDLNK